jgi:superfamily II DNA or RNA helicase
MKLRPHQEKAVKWAQERERGLVISPAGSGKSLMMAAIAKEYIYQIGGPVGVLAPTNETCAQCYSAMESLKVDMRLIEIRCPHSSVDFSGKGLVLVDECKHLPSDLWYNCLRGNIPEHIFGFDATPFKDFDEERNEKLLSIFGNESITIDRSEIGESLCEASVVLSDSTDANLEDRINSNTEKLVGIRKRFMRIPEGELRAMCLWQSIIDIGIVNNRARNLQVVRWAKTHPGEQVLALVPSVTLGEQLEAQIPNSRCVHSKLGAKRRKNAMDSFRAGDLKCMIATSLADEGLDLPNAKVLILVSGGRSSQKTVQRTARVLRSHHSKDGAIIYDFKDTFHPLAAKHATLRQGIYKELGYSFA